MLNWCSSFYNVQGCIYLHMISEIVFQIFKFSKALFVRLSSCSLMRNYLALPEHYGVSTVMMNLLKIIYSISLVQGQ